MRFLFFVLCVTLSACASLSIKSRSEANLIGLWEEDNPMVHAVELRNSDGTYMRKEVRRYPSHSPERQSAGRWSVVRDKYNVSLESISSKIWKGDIGKRWTMKIVSRTETVLVYTSTDGARVEQHKIGDASQIEFEKVQLRSP